MRERERSIIAHALSVVMPLCAGNNTNHRARNAASRRRVLSEFARKSIAVRISGRSIGHAWTTASSSVQAWTGFGEASVPISLKFPAVSVVVRRE
jgi:hypothetical protein